MNFLKKLPYEWQIGLRYTRAGRRSGRNSFISFISLISMAGIGLGVAALIIVLSVMNGFQKEVRDRMLSVVSHIEVSGAGGVLPDWQETARETLLNKHVKAAAPYVEGQALIISDSMRGVIVRGILPEQEPTVSEVISKIKQGSFTSLQSGEFNIVIGKDLALALDAHLGDKITLAVPQGQVTPAGVTPRLKSFTVTGIFEAGTYEYDSALVFVQMTDAEKLFRLSAPTGVRLRVDDLLQAPAIALELSTSLSGDLLLRDWSQQNRNYFAAVKVEKRMMFIILTLIIAVAAFNLVSTLVMTVRDKQADIAILRTLGASPASIMKIFMVQGSMVGTLGTLLGVGLGVIVALNIPAMVGFFEHLFGVQFLDKAIYFITSVPSDLHWDDVSYIGGMALVFALLSTIYPSWRASNVKPAEALRYE
ncbi:lipoprotein-releasing ABC transporter permease subunit [Solimicrobium silvestre]|uniref:LolCE: lipoprotein releasing system, transmembrane protein, LolC/E family n=1 Tax=Solimicrobium silvestre TaxID=2099400 RepID=A0A2S9GZ54_9BURK|nr:lipoprotein-releasing ABC transporter permease subunit [Solimicrobium silvestre]PRC93019.1 lolCE: lipoprotein releasing system, transmembrane protein, LolC/E family [Solimicrobium silvestre]